MKLMTTFMMLIAIVIMVLSIIFFLKIKKKIKGNLYCSRQLKNVISNSYVALLIFFVGAYFTFTVFWIRLTDYSTLDYMLLSLLFFGSMFVGVSTVFLYSFVNSMIGVKTNRTDTLTGLMTKEGIEIHAQRMLDDDNSKSVLVIMDLDNFKEVNDLCGHAAGDIVISDVAKIIREELRSDDLIGRFGGDEYLAVLYHTEIEQAGAIMKRIENEIIIKLRQMDYEMCTGISYGMAEIEGGSRMHYSDVFVKADEALYEMKKRKHDSEEL